MHAGIMAADAGDPLGLAFEVSISDWNSRVWTLQEGLLNQVVLFAQEHEYILHKRINTSQILLGYPDFARSTLLRHIGVGSLTKMTPSFILNFASGRSTSHDIDYVCGLDALLPQPISRIGSNVSSAAADMARTLRTIDIVFLSTFSPRSDIEGFRWMPLGCNDLYPTCDSGNIGVVRNNGLEVVAHSFYIFRLQRYNNLAPLEHAAFLGPAGDLLYTADGVIFAAHIDINIAKTYDFISHSDSRGMSSGFLVATGDSEVVVQYITAVRA
ncbi:hypothetical protein BGZ46_010742, partial [Entomortierella lignicola]